MARNLNETNESKLSAASLPLPDREDRHPSLRTVATGVIAANRLEGSARGETAEV